MGMQEQLLRRNVKRFRGGLVFKAHRLLHHSSLGFRVIKKKKVDQLLGGRLPDGHVGRHDQLGDHAVQIEAEKHVYLPWKSNQANRNEPFSH